MQNARKRAAISGVATIVLVLPAASFAQSQAPAVSPAVLADDQAQETSDPRATGTPADNKEKDGELGKATPLSRIIVPFYELMSPRSRADVGTTTLDQEGFTIRTDGSGDANSALRGLPNVQYQNETDTDAGIDGQKILDTRPELLSISGGRTYENNFIVNGIPTNTVTGSVERYGNSELASDTNTPNADRFYGLHPQTIFVPSDFVDSVTVVDSNASARYGNFQGGVPTRNAGQARQASRSKATSSSATTSRRPTAPTRSNANHRSSPRSSHRFR